MRYLVESFSKIQGSDLNTLTLIHLFHYSMYCGDQLGIAGQFTSKAMLVIAQYCIEIFIEIMKDNVFQHLTDYGC